MNYIHHLTIYFSIYLLLALGLNVLVGYCGRLALTHVLFYSVGAYGYAFATLRLSASFVSGMLFAVLLALLGSVTLACMTHRFRKDQYVLMSLAMQTLGASVFANWYDNDRQFGTLASLTNGPYGVDGIPWPDLLGGTRELSAFTLLAVPLASGFVVVISVLLRSPWARALKAYRDNPAVAQSLGKRGLRLHVEASIVAGVMASVAGGLYASYVRFLEPSMAGLDNAVLVLSMVIIGGVGNLRGPVAGALVIVFLPEILRVMRIPDASLANVQLAVYGVALTLAMHFRPQGLLGVPLTPTRN